MGRRTVAAEPALTVDRTAAHTMPRQLADALRDQIRRRVLRPGWQLPATRELARQLGVSRAVAQMAYDQLRAEGWVEGRTGAGTFVVDVGDLELPRGRGSRRRAEPAPAAALISLRPGTPLAAGRAEPGWRRAWREVSARVPPSGYPDPYGLPELRAAIAEYLARARGVACDPEEVLVTDGTTHGLRLLLAAGPHQRIGLEDPGYRSAARAIGAGRLVDCPVDGEGVVVDRLPPRLSAVYVTPAHQYPLGGRLTAARRTALIGWARRHHALVVEDDYDGEFRYDVEPLPALAQLDRGRVVYLGTVSKVLGPALRLGWLVADAALVERIAAWRSGMGDWPAWPSQRALLALLGDGQVDQAIKRDRRRYVKRRTRVCAALEPYGRVVGQDAGMHVSLLLPAGTDAEAVRSSAADAGVDVDTLAHYRRSIPGPPGLVVGYGGCSDAELDRGLDLLAAVLARAVG